MDTAMLTLLEVTIAINMIIVYVLFEGCCLHKADT